jgi:hypothetical protein
MPGKTESGEKAQCTREYMSILSRFPTQHGATRGFFNSLLRAGTPIRIPIFLCSRPALGPNYGGGESGDGDSRRGRRSYGTWCGWTGALSGTWHWVRDTICDLQIASIPSRLSHRATLGANPPRCKASAVPFTRRTAYYNGESTADRSTVPSASSQSDSASPRRPPANLWR